MRLRWKKFERSLRPRLRPHDARRQMSWWRRIGHWLLTGWSPLTPNLFTRSCPTALILAILVGISIDEPDTFQNPVCFGIIAAWCLLITTIRAGLYQTISATDPVYRTLWFLPLTSLEIFNHLSRRILFASAFLFMEIAAAYICISQNVDPRASISVALFRAILQVLLCLALTLLLLVINIRPEFHHGVFIILGLWTISALAIPLAAPAFVKFSIIPNPFAWINAFYTGSFIQKAPGSWRYLLPALALIATIPWALRKVRLMHDNGVFRKKVIIRKGRPTVQNEEPPPRPIQTSAADDSAKFAPELGLIDWNSFGVAERIIGLALKPREKCVAQMLLADTPPWTRYFRAITSTFILFLVVNYFIDATQVLRFFTGPAPGRVHFLPFLLLFAGMLLAAFMVNRVNRLFRWFAWPEPARNPGPGARLALNLRIFPANHWECVVVIAKINLISLLLLIPVAILFAFTPSWQFLEENLIRSPTSLIPFLII